ncbi:MAG TPA: PIN domain-containing protein [Chloroflexota bacterium]|nr:PIN domain-containing protein [Chloroflexota bacterium]
MNAHVRSGLPRHVFLDSSGYLAVTSQRDVHHQTAARAWATFVREGWLTYTSNYVVAETHALFLTRLGRGPAARFLAQFDATATVVLQVRPADQERARQLVFQYDDKTFSFTDATSFVLMERLRIGVALTTDHNFAQYGFQMVGVERRS